MSIARKRWNGQICGDGQKVMKQFRRKTAHWLGKCLSVSENFFWIHGKHFKCRTNISTASLSLQFTGGPGRNRYWHCSNPRRNFCSCATVSIFLLQSWLFFVQFEIPRRVCNLTLTGQVSTNHLIWVKKFVMTQHNVTFYRETANRKKLQNKQTK